MVRVFVVPRLTATAAARYNSLPVPEQDRALWTGQVLRKTFGTWAEAALANLPTRERAATRLREPRRAFVSLGRVSVMCPETTLAALRSAAGDTLEVYPDAAILGVWASLCLEEELARRVGI